MAQQTKWGKAFEYACLNAFWSRLKDIQDVEIVQTPALQTARNCYYEADSDMIAKMDAAAEAATRMLFRLEPQLENPNNNTPLLLSVQDDKQGVAGDVRDVLCIRSQNDWEIGLSCKHNHDAVKHSRLSQTIDFGSLWLGIPCTTQYFLRIKPVFDLLNEWKEQGIKWRDVKDKEETVYMPILDAFCEELRLLDTQNPGEVPSRLLMYLLGRKDFYKIITDDNKKITKVQAFNISGTLNRQSGTVKPERRVERLVPPTKIFNISYKESSQNTIYVHCDNGWWLSFRIHNASTYVEPSLKFDVQLKGSPVSLYTQIEPW